MTGYKINTYKSIAFVYGNYEFKESSMFLSHDCFRKGNIVLPFIIASQKINYLGENLTKEIEDFLTTEN